MQLREGDAMSDAKHSPGPWHVDGPRQNVYDQRGRHIATATAHNVGIPEMFGNARLIAAAPVMREALQVLLDATKDVDPEEGAAKALEMLRSVGIALDD